MTAAAEPSPLPEPGEIELLHGLAGFPAARRFAVEPWGGAGSPYALLRCLDVDGLAFVVVGPDLFFPSYAPVIDDDLASDLELTTADDALVLVIVTVGDPVERSTANLLGPVVVNRHTRRGAQAVLSPEAHSTREPLVVTGTV